MPNFAKTDDDTADLRLCVPFFPWLQQTLFPTWSLHFDMDAQQAGLQAEYRIGLLQNFTIYLVNITHH